VYHDGVWGSVCDHGFTETEVSVACRSLGFTYVSQFHIVLALSQHSTKHVEMIQYNKNLTKR